jgi:HAE1 family hydrophobic/amphiphilic exporter-1
MSGITGQLFKDFALTVVIATIFSIVASFTVTPMLAALILPDHAEQKNRFGVAFERLFKSFENGYRNALHYILGNKKRSLAVIGLALLLFAASVVFLAGVSFDFLPSMDNNKINITAELPQGYNLDETGRLVQRIEERVRKHPEVVTIVTTLGKTSDLNEGVNWAKMSLKLTDKKARKRSDKELAGIFTKELADLPNAQIKSSAISGFDIGTAPVDFYLKGQNLDQLETYAAKLLPKLQKIPGLMNVDTSTRSGKLEVTLYPDRVTMTEAGITVQELAVLLRTAVEGLEIAEYKENGNEYDIRVVLNKESIPNYEELGNLPVYTRLGTFPISHFARLKFTQGYNKILHSDKSTVIEFTADLMPGYALGDITHQVEKTVAKLSLPAGYGLKWVGFADLMNEMITKMAFAFGLAILLTFMLLAATLENFSQPLQIMGTIPLCMIGVAAALALTGISLSIVAILAIIMLVGIVVNNAILILDQTNQLRATGLDLRSALLEACPTKLKAIIMSNLAAILGMLPMALGIGPSAAEARQPIGIVSIGGLISSTVLTLVVIPAVEILIGEKRDVNKSSVSTTEVSHAG